MPPEVNALISQAESAEDNQENNSQVEENLEGADGADGDQEGEDNSSRQSQESAEPELTPLEAVAASMGWKPKSKWKGDASTWSPADEYLSAVPKYISRLQEHNRQNKRELERISEETRNLTRTSHAMRDAEIKRIKEQYEEAKFKAAEDGDADLWNKLRKEEEEVLERAQPRHEQHQDADTMAAETLKNPALNRFYRTHAWILDADDDGPYQYAVQVANEAMGKGATQVQAIAAAEQALVYSYPEMYQRRQAPNGQQRQNQNGQQQQNQERARDPNTGQFVAEVQKERRAAAQVSNGQRTPQKDGGVSAIIAKLPPEVRVHMDAEVKRGHKAEDWLKIYHNVSDLKDIKA